MDYPPEPTAPAPTPAADIFPDLNPWEEAAGLRDRIFRVLRPFARMDRVGTDRDELACQRGVASDMTVLTSGDFAEALELLMDLGDSEFADEIWDDDRYVDPRDRLAGAQ